MLNRTRVKICGITNREDAMLAAELGADALGFIFFARSPRCITPEGARAIIEGLPPYVTTVAVVVNESCDSISRIMTESGCQVVQAHGDEGCDSLARLAWPVVKGVSVSRPEDLAVIERYPWARAILLDTKIAGQYGGTGQTFDWTLARSARQFSRPIILAGGLSPENVEEALRTAIPDAIDVNSGIEVSPGRKDPARMRQLFTTISAVEAARERPAGLPSADRY